MWKVVFGLLFLMCLALVGCNSGPSFRNYERGVPITDDLIASIQEGITTKEELIEELGQPFTATRLSDGVEVYMWSHTKAVRPRSKTIYGSDSPPRVDTTVLSVVFSKNGTVSYFTTSFSSVEGYPLTFGYNQPNSTRKMYEAQAHERYAYPTCLPYTMKIINV